jgi:hypothetical protein
MQGNGGSGSAINLKDPSSIFISSDIHRVTNNEGINEGISEGIKFKQLNQINTMETTINKKQMLNAKNASELEAGVIAALPKIIDFARHNDYVIKNDEGFLAITQSQLLDTIKNLSLKKRKVLRNYLWVIDNYPSLANINKFLHFLMAKVLKGDVRYRLLKSEKQLKIEEKRKKYLELLSVAKAAYKDYKDEKADFYKLRLEHKKRIE